MDLNSTLTNSTELVMGHNSVPPILVISIYIVNFLLGVPLNVYVIVLLFPWRGAMEVSDVFSWNQAVSEMFFALLAPLHILCSLKFNMCFLEVAGLIFGTCLSSRCLFQSCVCVERYLAVVHPVTFLRYKPLRYRVACSIMVWMCSLGIGVSWSCTFPNIPYSAFSVLYLLVFIVGVFCCVSILRKLMHPGPRDKERDGEMNAAKKKAFQVVSVNLLAFLIQNIPVSVTFGLRNTLSEYKFSMMLTISLSINMLTELLRPVFVLHRAGKLPVVCSTPSSSC